jgi:hypothetical protein
VRRAWLDEACVGSPGLRAAVEAILRADSEAGGVLDNATGAAVEDLLRRIEDDRMQPVRVDPRTAADPEDVLRRLLQQGYGSAEESEDGGLLPGTLLVNRYRIGTSSVEAAWEWSACWPYPPSRPTGRLQPSRQRPMVSSNETRLAA